MFDAPQKSPILGFGRHFRGQGIKPSTSPGIAKIAHCTMFYIETLIGITLTLSYLQAPTPQDWAVTINSKNPVITRTCPDLECAGTGIILSGTYRLKQRGVLEPTVNQYGEWHEIYVSPFSNKTVWMRWNYNTMSLVKPRMIVVCEERMVYE